MCQRSYRDIQALVEWFNLDGHGGCILLLKGNPMDILDIPPDETELEQSRLELRNLLRQTAPSGSWTDAFKISLALERIDQTFADVAQILTNADDPNAALAEQTRYEGNCDRCGRSASAPCNKTIKCSWNGCGGSVVCNRPYLRP